MSKYQKYPQDGALTSILTGTNEVNNVGVLAKLTKNLQLSCKVSVIVLRGKL